MALFEGDHLSFAYRHGKPVFQDLSFRIDEGEFLGIVGPNGVGKSTLLKLLNRILRPQSGALLFRGKNLERLKQIEIARQIAMVRQESTLMFPFKVTDVVFMGRYPHLKPFAFEEEEDRKRVREAMEMTEVTELSHRLFNELSGGERQRVMLASALAQTPQVLLLDEPTASLDLKHQLAVYELLKRLNREHRMVIITVTHDLNLAALFCERIMLLHTGRLVASGSPDQVLVKEVLRAVYQVDIYLGKHPEKGTPYVIPLRAARDEGRLEE